jgi:hypothetical protein
MIVRQKNISLVKGWVKYDLTKMIKFEDAVSNCEDSPVKRAVYYRDSWYPMPVMENYSGYDRETNNWIQGTNPNPIEPTKVEPQDSPSNPVNPHLNPSLNPVNPPEPIDTALNPVNPRLNLNPILNPLEPISEPSEREMLERVYNLEPISEPSEPNLDDLLVNVFLSAKNLVPKTVREIRKIRSIANTGASPEQVKERLDYLTLKGELIQMGKGWVLPAWGIEDLN